MPDLIRHPVTQPIGITRIPGQARNDKTGLIVAFQIMTQSLYGKGLQMTGI